jgi:hypothetical protein
MVEGPASSRRFARCGCFGFAQDDMYEVGGDDGADASILSELSALNEV